MNLKKSEPTADGTESGAERGELTGKLLLVGGGVVALVGAGALAFVLLSGGDEPLSTSALPTPSASAPAPTDTASPSTSASIPTYAAKNARDPFKPLVREASAGGSGAGGSVSPTTVPTSSSSLPAWTPPATTVTITATPSTSSSTTSPTAQPTVPYDVTLIVLSKIIDETHVEIVVDDFAVSAEVGYTFGPFKLKSVDTVAQTATVQYGEVMLNLPLHQVVLLQNA
jgi:hypothetical protein